MQRVSNVTSQTQERTTQARTFIKALRQSCEPWQRLAAAEPMTTPVVGSPLAAISGPILRAPDGGHVRSSRPSVLARGSSSMGHDQKREGISSER